MKKTWILVADSTHARIFTAASPSSALQEIETLAHPESRLHEQKLTSDLPGKAGGSGTGTGHAYQSETDPKKYEAEQFARYIAGHLQQALDAGRFEQLLLIASPSFLGVLRGQLSSNVQKKTCYELDKNITLLSAEVIRGYLPEYLPGL
jgi:protein required for attachment to host cells